ncbi:MAG: NmrA family protein [Symbiobacteriaceae bacterium]|nr:NmrA family protein [Symbiobacteriaceae bacterium]
MQSLLEAGAPVVAAVRNIDKARSQLGDALSYVTFDITDPTTFAPALAGIDRIFLMRPPVITDMHKVLTTLLAAAEKAGVRQVVYLSVSGADKIPFNPHRSVERVLQQSTIPWTILRPGFFMQNLNMHHTRLIQERGEICVPAGRGKTAFIDTRDIGEAAAKVLTQKGHERKAYTLTGTEALTYFEAAEICTAVWGRPIKYSNPSPLAFRRVMLAQGYPSAFVNFMIMLYFLTRVGGAARITNDLPNLLGRAPRSLRDYAADYADHFAPIG